MCWQLDLRDGIHGGCTLKSIDTKCDKNSFLVYVYFDSQLPGVFLNTCAVFSQEHACKWPEKMGQNHCKHENKFHESFHKFLLKHFNLKMSPM